MKVRRLTFKHHHNAPYFFKELSFELELRKLNALHGKNGMGKTVLLQLLTNHVPAHGVMKGEVFGNERAVLVNQRFDRMIADQFTFEENLKFANMGRFPSPFSSLHCAHVQPDFLEQFHIDMSKPVNQLSGGQRQILSLLMVLQKKPDVLLLDEPTAALDEQNARLVFEFLRTLTLQNVTLLVVCHDSELVSHYTDGLEFQLEMAADGVRQLKNGRG